MKRWFHPAFEVELIEEARYHARQRDGLGGQFIDEVEAAIEDIMQAPATWRTGRGDIRRYILPRFRYTVRYRMRSDEDLVEFLSLIHTSRHPDTGVDRWAVWEFSVSVGGRCSVSAVTVENQPGLQSEWRRRSAALH